MRVTKLGTAVLLGATLLFALVSGCGGSRAPDDDDAMIAFGKHVGDLNELERSCLRNAQTFCAGLGPCCQSIKHDYEQEICLMVRAEHCVAPGTSSTAGFKPDGAQQCLDKLEHQFDECLQPLGEGFRPIELHQRPVCDGAWPAPVGPARYAPEEECSFGLKVCPVGQLCDHGVPEGQRFCVPLAAAGEPCSNTSDCQSGLRCDEQDACRPLLAEGSACTFHDDCDTALCCGHVCVRAPAVDAHLCWIFNYPGGPYDRELADAYDACPSITSNAMARDK
jgi:hypothetical protein